MIAAGWMDLGLVRSVHRSLWNRTGRTADENRLADDLWYFRCIYDHLQLPYGYSD